MGGVPIIPGEHEQVALSFMSRQIELGPHGEGTQGTGLSSKTGSTGISRHLTKGSPVVLGGQLQIAE